MTNVKRVMKDKLDKLGIAPLPAHTTPFYDGAQQTLSWCLGAWQGPGAARASRRRTSLWCEDRPCSSHTLPRVPTRSRRVSRPAPSRSDALPVCHGRSIARQRCKPSQSTVPLLLGGGAGSKRSTIGTREIIDAMEEVRARRARVAEMQLNLSHMRDGSWRIDG